MVLNLSFKLKVSICSFLKFRPQMPSDCGLHHDVVFCGPFPSHCLNKKIPVAAVAVD